jgi:H(+)-transporting ATP synthase subunit D
MSRIGETSGTRMALLRARQRSQRVSHGAALLRKKREALVAELLRLARPAADTRARIEARMQEALPALLEALAANGAAELDVQTQPRELRVELHTAQVWGTSIVELVRHSTITRTLPARGTAPGPTSPLAARAATQFEQLVDLLVEAAPRELLLRRLGAALTRTSRQVHALEQRVMPTLDDQIARVSRALDEREREEKFRMKHLLIKRATRDA